MVNIPLIDAFRTLRRFQCSVNFDVFVVIFGDVMASHLWDKFTSEYRSNLLEFFSYLDGKNKDVLCDYISNNYLPKIDFTYRTEVSISGNVIAHDLEDLASDNGIDLSQMKNTLNALFPVEYKRLNR